MLPPFHFLSIYLSIIFNIIIKYNTHLQIHHTDKSEAEMQRFCQSFMTELVKYVGPDLDLPTMGMGVGEKEFGYLAGQHKRISIKSSSGGRPFLAADCPEVSFKVLKGI